MQELKYANAGHAAFGVPIPVGNPALVVPMGFTASGLPLSLQLAARPFEEAVAPGHARH